MKIYVFGLGHIGLPIAAWVAQTLGEVYGIDKDSVLIHDIQTNAVKIHEYYHDKHISQLVWELINNKRLAVNTQFERQDKEASVFIIAVGISPDSEGRQDTSPLNEVLNSIIPALVEGDLLIFKTTMIPGSCEKLIAPRLNALDFTVHLAYCPETIAEGKAFDELENNPRILSAIDNESYTKAEKFFLSLSPAAIYRASNMRTAEMAKVVQNISRDVNIALINELSDIARCLNIDIHEMQQLCNTHPRVDLLQPGPGVGGYCLPNALGYLQAACTDKESPALSSLARTINENRPQKVVRTIIDALKSVDKDIKGSIIAIYGLAMKDFCADCRCSPALDIAEQLIALGAKVKAFDSLVPLSYPFQFDSFQESIDKADCLLITTRQSSLTFDSKEIIAKMASDPIVVDTRNIFPSSEEFNLYKI